MLRVWRDGQWHSINWGEFRPNGRVLRPEPAGGRHLRRRPRGDLCMENRPEYPIAETALMAIRAVPVPAYTTNTVDDHAHLLRDSGARAAIVSSAALAAERLLRASAKTNGLDHPNSWWPSTHRHRQGRPGRWPSGSGRNWSRTRRPHGRHRSGGRQYPGDRAWPA